MVPCALDHEVGLGFIQASAPTIQPAGVDISFAGMSALPHRRFADRRPRKPEATPRWGNLWRASALP